MTSPLRIAVDLEVLRPRLAELETRCVIFDALPLDPLHRDWFRQRAWIRTVHGTTRIEGNTLSDIQVEQLLEDRVSAGSLPRKDALEVLGTRSALAFVDELALDREIPVDQALVREIHRRVLDGQVDLLTPGEYRRGENRVVGADGKPIFTTPPSGDVPELMRAFVAWVEGAGSALPSPVRAALAHLEFVAIHPFNDGNGRTSRALARLLLVRGGYSLDGLVSLDAYLDLHRSEYFEAIRASIGASYAPGYDATPFAEFFVGAIVDAADHVLARLRGLGQVQIAIRRAIVSGALVPSMLDGLAFAWIHRSIRPLDYARITGRSPFQASRDLAAAVKSGYLTATGSTSDRIYLLGPRLLETPAEGEVTRRA